MTQDGQWHQDRLEIASFEVDRVVLGEKTQFTNGVVTINRVELRGLLLEDHHFREVEIDIASPGDDLRVVHALDAVEPRVRESEPSTDFPGLLAAPRTVGTGRTNRLSGVAVTEAAEPVPGEPTYWREAIFDMAGDGASYSPFSSLINVVLTFHPWPDQFPETGTFTNLGTLEALEYTRAVRLAGLKAAVYLAQATLGLPPDRVDTYSLDHPIAERLPRIAYVYQVAQPYVYGEFDPGGGFVEASGYLPTVIHPNEILDGALVNAWTWYGCVREPTFTIQNHPIIDELYRAHGAELDFRGVVLYTYGDRVATKERITSYAANLAALLGADGAILNYSGGGHPGIDLMMVCERLEKRGIRTALLMPEIAANAEDSGFVHFVKDADAIISTGNFEEQIDLLPVGKVLGGTRILESGEDASGPLNLTLRHFLASTDQLGSHVVRGRQY